MSSFEGLYGIFRVEVGGLAKSEVGIGASTTTLAVAGSNARITRRSHCATRKSKKFPPIILLQCRVVSVSEWQHTSRDGGSARRERRLGAILFSEFVTDVMRTVLSLTDRVRAVGERFINTLDKPIIFKSF